MYKIALSIISLIAIAVTLLLVQPQWKEKVRDLILRDSYALLAEEEADIRNDGSIIRVSKLKINGKIYLRFFEMNGDVWKPIQTILLPDSYDGYATIAGDPKNLAILNLDDDGLLEVIAPTFDKDMIAYLNIYKYSIDSKAFTKIQNEQSLMSR